MKKLMKKFAIMLAICMVFQCAALPVSAEAQNAADVQKGIDADGINEEENTEAPVEGSILKVGNEPLVADSLVEDPALKEVSVPKEIPVSKSVNEPEAAAAPQENSSAQEDISPEEPEETDAPETEASSEIKNANESIKRETLVSGVCLRMRMTEFRKKPSYTLTKTELSIAMNASS